VQVKTKTLIVGGVAVLMVGLLWYRVVYSPIKSKTSTANAAAHNAEADAKNLQDEIDNIMASSKKDAAKDVGAARMLTAVPADTAEASFLRSLDALRGSSGANWQSVTPGTPSAAGGVTSISVSINVFGTEGTLARYLDGLYSMRRVFVPDNVTLTPQGQSQLGGAGALFVGGLMQMQVSGRIFAGPAAAPTTATSGSSGSTGTSTTGTATTSSH
jgi:Tfp pilus assembly protein PilO